MIDPDFPYFDENQVFVFPSPSEATEEGIVTWGGNLSPGMVLSAYRQGIFPWYSEGEPVLWWSPDPRFVIPIDDFHTSRSLERVLKKGRFQFSFDQAFSQVIRECGSIPRREETGTWIVDEMIEGYENLHRLGWAHSVEVWQDGVLVGGLYGVSLGRIFFGESMFSKVSNSSKAALAVLVRSLKEFGFEVIDSQVHTPHLESMGAQNISRERYLTLLFKALEHKDLRGDWGTLVPIITTKERHIL